MEIFDLIVAFIEDLWYLNEYDSWRGQDGFDILVKQSQDDINFLKEVHRYVRKRQLIEEEHADKMSKLISKQNEVQPLG